MYKHVVDSIKESTRKRFISQSEKDKFNNYDEIFIEKESAYTKNEFDEIVSDLETREETFNSSIITIDGSDNNSLVTSYEIKGNSICNTNESNGITNYTLSSLGKLQQDGQYKINIASCGKNIIGDEWEQGSFDGYTGEPTTETHEHFNFRIRSKKFIPINKKYTHITCSTSGRYKAAIRFFDKNKNFIYVENLQGFITNLEKAVIDIPPDAEYFIIVLGDINAGGSDDNVLINPDTITTEEIGCLFEYGTEVTSYEPFIGGIEHEIILPCKLEKIGNISDRLFVNNKGNWCIEKNIKTITIDESFIIERREDLDSENTERYSISIPDQDILHLNKLPCPVFSTKIKCIVDVNSTNPWVNMELSTHIFGHNVVKEVHVKRLKTDDSLFTDLESLKTLMNGSVLKYVTESPEIIELSYDKNTIPMYNNQTNIYMIDSNIQPESIKLTAPLTMMSTVNTLSDKFIGIDNRIEKVSKGYSNSKTYHETDNGTQIIPNVSNGILDDIHIEGKTLVNLSDTYNKITWLNENPSQEGFSKYDGYFKIDFDIFYDTHTAIIDDSISIKAGKTYTYIVTIADNKLTSKSELFPHMWNNAVNKSESEYIDPGFEGRKVFKFDCVNDTVFKFGYRHGDQSGRGSYRVGEIMVLEGDHTKNPPSYFEGLKSVGEGLNDKELVNLAIQRNTLQGGLSYDSSTNTYTSSVQATRFTTEPINVSYNETYTLMYEFMCDKEFTVSSNNNGMICRVDAENSNCQFVKTYAHHEINKTYKANKWYKITNVFKIDDNTVTRIIPCIRNSIGVEANMSMRNIMIFSGDQSHIKIPYFENTRIISNPLELSTISNTPSSQYDIKQYTDKKALYYFKDNEWLKPVLRSLPDSIYDTVEKHSNGKYYYHKRCGEVALDGSDDETIGVRDNLNNTIGFTIDMGDETGNLGKVISDRFLYKLLDVSNDSDEFTRIITPNGNSCLYFKINKSKLSTHDVQGFKQWLRNNNVTVVYELAEEKIYECTNIDLSLFEDTTIFNIDSGYILPKVSFHTNDNIGNTIQSLKERVLLLENSLLDRAILHNRLMLSNRYSADRTKFNVNVVTLSANNRSCEIDVELIKLILSNISEGVLNYNRVWMEELIDFYTIMGIIPFEIADRLFELIESQYFEPSLNEVL